jgi:glycosyltransferase involved in cell wall biosynthesis
MHYFWTGLLGAIALLWAIQGVRVLWGMRAIPRFAEVLPLPDSRCPTVSILIAARDEDTSLPRALPTVLNQDYPCYEVIAVDDRSCDDTSRILDDFARRHSNLKVVHLSELPERWLGKAHALNRAYKQSTGDWLLFTDADVCLAPDTLRRALAVAEQNEWDYLTTLAQLELPGFWDATTLTLSIFWAVLSIEAWPVNHPRSGRCGGFGTFQLLRRAAYESIGRHERLAMEVLDDFKLGKLVKQSGFPGGVALSESRLRVRSSGGLGGAFRNNAKNAFAACDFRLAILGVQLLRLVSFNLLPFVGLVFTTSTPRILAAISVVAVLALHSGAARRCGVSLAFALTHPLGVIIFLCVLLRSTIVTLWHGGVYWRNTFYPLDELRRGLV